MTHNNNVFFWLFQHRYSMTNLMHELQKIIKERNSSTPDEDNTSIGAGLQRKDLTTTFWIFLTVVSFWIAWGAIVGATLVLIYFKNSVSNVTMRYAVQTIVAINSCINPILYAFHIKHIKSATNRLFSGLCCGSPTAIKEHKQEIICNSDDPGYLTESKSDHSST